MMFIKGFNLNKELRLLQRSFAANEAEMKGYKTGEYTKRVRLLG
jgi:hypothetical protein